MNSIIFPTKNRLRYFGGIYANFCGKGSRISHPHEEYYFTDPGILHSIYRVTIESLVYWPVILSFTIH